MIAAIAFAFRALNVQLLYRQGLVAKVFKASYLASVYFYKWWMNTRRQPQLVIINNFDRDLKIQVDVSKSMGAALYWTGFHEFNEMRFLNQYLKEEMTFIDVGANQGEFALFASRRLQRGRVLAFEPMSLFFDRLTFNVQLNDMKNVQCYRLGLSDRRDKVPIYFNANNELNHEGLASLFSRDQHSGRNETISLEVLDDVVARESVDRIDLIKIDVEGAEWAVLRGCQHILVNQKPALMIELNDETAALAGYQVNEMVAWLKQFGYVAYQILKNGLKPLTDRPAFCNAVFLVETPK